MYDFIISIWRGEFGVLTSGVTRAWRRVEGQMCPAKKVLFIVPPNLTFTDFTSPGPHVRAVEKAGRHFGNVVTDMPIGIFSLSAFIKSNADVTTRLLDFNIELNKSEAFPFASYADYFRAVLGSSTYRDYRPDIIGVSALFSTAYFSLLDIASVCRDIFPQSVIVAGGGIPTNMYKDIFSRSTAFDALCCGEGELPLLGLVKASDARAYLASDDAWITREKVLAGKTFRQRFVENLDDIPFYDYDVCEVRDYELNPAIVAYAGVKKKTANFYVMTSLGCPFQCIFCSSHTVHGRKMRYYSLARVADDFQRLKERYRAEVLVFQDDHFLADKKRALAIIEIVKKLGFSCVFQNSLALYALDRNMLETLKSAGIDALTLSIESGSQRVLKEIMRKPLNLSTAQRVVADCRELGIATTANVLIGLPGERKQDVADAREFLRGLNASWYFVFCANPLVGSEMYEICREKNYLKGPAVGSDYRTAVVETEDFTAEYIQYTAYAMNLELNFVNNSDMRLGAYENAIKGFLRAINSKADHVFGYYYAAQCYRKLGDVGQADDFLAKAKQCASNPFWKKYIEEFGLQKELLGGQG